MAQPAPHSHDHEHAPDPVLREVSPGIYAYVQLDGSWGLNNTGFLVGEDGVVVIDTCGELDVLAAISDMITFNGGRPLRCLA